MATESNSELLPMSPEQPMCHLCQVPMQAGAKAAHQKGLQHQAARQITAIALDRWRAHMAPNSALHEPLQEPLDTESIIFCDICTEAVPSTVYTQHVTGKSHLISALDEKGFEELVQVYVDEEDLKLLDAPEQKDGDGDESAAGKGDAKTAYKCHICDVKVPSAFKSEHERSNHHRTRVALATAAARRLSAALRNPTPIRVPNKRNINMTTLLKLYTGIDLMKKNEQNDEVVIEKEIEVEDKASQSEVKKRFTAKQYFTDILPYLQYTEALYTLIVDDTEYVTIKNTNGTCMRVHVANFNGIYSDAGDMHYNMKCRMCHGYSNYVYSSELNHDKLHVMSLGHIRHVLTPIDNVHGIRKIDNRLSLCILCNMSISEHDVENHIFNDFHHTAFLAEALKLGRNFKESQDDLKVIIYSAPPVEKSNFMRHPIRNFDSVLNPGFINFPYTNGLFGAAGGNVSFPQGSNSSPGGNASKSQGSALFAASSNKSTGFGASATTQSFGGGQQYQQGAAPGSGSIFAASKASPASTGATFGAQSASGSIFGASNASTNFGASPVSTGASLDAHPVGFGLHGGPANSSPAFGPASVGVFGGSIASTKPASGGVFGASNSSNANTNFGAKRANTGFNAGPTVGGTGTFGAQPASNIFGTSSASTGFNASPVNASGTFGTGSAIHSEDLPENDGTTVITLPV